MTFRMLRLRIRLRLSHARKRFKYARNIMRMRAQYGLRYRIECAALTLFRN